jgi:protein-S-isoprenylcysteine O-methyltransferase Ste14
MPKRKDLIYVGLQFVLLIALFINPLNIGAQIHRWTGLLGFLICGSAVVFGLAAVVQLGTNLTPWPSPKKNSELVTTGTFAWARHPIYASLIWFAIGLSVGYLSLWKFIVTALLILLFYYKSTFEESMLREQFEEYESYQNRVNRFGSFRLPTF